MRALGPHIAWRAPDMPGGLIVPDRRLVVPRPRLVLPGIGVPWHSGSGAPAGSPSISYITNANVSGASATHNMGTLSIGAEGTNRVTILAVSGYVNGPTLGSVTIDTGGGDTACRLCKVDYGTTTCAAIAALATPSGTTGTIKINWSGGSGYHAAVAVYRAVDLNSAVEVTTGSDTTPSSGAVSFTLNNNAASIMVVSAVSIDGTAWSGWSSGLTEDSDQYIASSNAAAAASGIFASANTPYTVSATAGTGTRGVAVAATWNN